jgi:hemolysin activation/secretion protein
VKPRFKRQLKNRKSRLLAACVFCVALPMAAWGQAYDRIAPSMPPPSSAPTLAAPSLVPPEPASARPILPALKAIVYANGPAALASNGLPLSAAGPSEISAPGLPLLESGAFQEKIRPFLNMPVTLDALNRIAALTLSWYRAHGQPFVDISIPPQNINNGLVQVVVTDYRVGDITVSGNRWFSSNLIAHASGLEPGQGLTINGLQNDLSWLNQNPFLTVNAVFQPGGTTGVTNINLQATDQFPLRVYAGYDNLGVKSLGVNEWFMGFNWGNAFGLGQILSYQLTRSFTGRYTGHSISDVIPLPWQGNKLLIFGSYELQRPEIAEGFDDLGRSGQASIRYVRTLPNFSWLTQDVQLGYDFKTTNTNLDFGGDAIFNSIAEIDQFVLTYDGNETDRYGQAAIENDFIWSPGGLTSANNTASFETFVPYATSHYVYDRIGLTRTTNLPWHFSWVARLMAQFSNENLLDSEQLSAGGPTSVAGYPTNTALGSNGEMINMTVFAPAFSPSQYLGLHLPIQNQVQVGAFWDYAHLYQDHAIPDEINQVDLASVGLELNCAAGQDANVQFVMGWQLRNAPYTEKHGGFGQVSVVIGY